MKKLFAISLALILALALVSCGETDTNTSKDDQTAESQQEQSLNPVESSEAGSGAAVSTEWPSNTIFPKPEGCRIIEVKSEGWKNYITVEWESKEAAQKYIEIVKQVEGDAAEVIGAGETDDSVYYGTYGITVTSMNEAENLVLYK